MKRMMNTLKTLAIAKAFPALENYSSKRVSVKKMKRQQIGLKVTMKTFGV